MADAASGKQAVRGDSRMDAVREEGAATPPTSTSLPCSPAQPPIEQSLPGHRVTVNPFPRRMSVSRKMRKLEEKSSLAGKGREDGLAQAWRGQQTLRRFLPSLSSSLFSPKIFRLPLPMPSVAYWPQ